MLAVLAARGVPNYFGEQRYGSLGNSHLMTAVSNARLIDVRLNNGAIVSNQGKEGPVNYAPVASYDGSNTALFIANEWKVNERIKIDGGSSLGAKAFPLLDHKNSKPYQGFHRAVKPKAVN